MRTVLSRFVVFAAALHLMGGHWMVLQTVAWSGMLYSYSKDSGFRTAVEKTFDGSAPCHLCHAVEEGQEKEKENQLFEPSNKQDAVLAKAVVAPCRSFPPFSFSLEKCEDSWSIDSGPDIPPPQIV